MFKRFLLLLTGLLLLASSPPPPLSFTVRPTTSVAPSQVMLSVVVLSRKEFSLLVWECQGDSGFETEESMGLPPDRPVFLTRTFSDLEPGNYECRAEVDGKTSTLHASTTFKIY